MKLMEYQARKIFEDYGIAVKAGVVIDSLEEIEKSVKGLTFPLVVKAQVQVGGRGKAGGIQFAEDTAELKEICGKLLHSELKGHKVNQLLLVEKASGFQELYISILLDRLSKKPMMIFSREGGVDIEETAVSNPDAILKISINPMIGVRKYMAQYAADKCGFGSEFAEALYELMLKLYRAFSDKDATLVEINPLLLVSEKELLALDGKVDVDDSALYRQPDILAYRDALQEEELVLEARKYNFLYIPVEEGADVAVISNGSGMLMSSIDLIAAAGMKVGAVLDLGGGATAERIREAIRIVLSNKDVKYLFINIFGGITRCNEVAEGIRLAMQGMQSGKSVIVRLEGTNKSQGIEILGSIDCDVVSVNGLRDGVQELWKRKEGRA